MKVELEQLGFLVCRIFKIRLNNQFILLSSEEYLTILSEKLMLKKKMCTYVCNTYMYHIHVCIYLYLLYIHALYI